MNAPESLIEAHHRLREMLNVAGSPVGADAEGWHDEARHLVDVLYKGCGQPSPSSYRRIFSKWALPHRYEDQIRPLFACCNCARPMTEAEPNWGWCPECVAADPDWMTKPGKASGE